jgi:hypothetical protein
VLLVRLAEPSSRPPMPLARGGGAYHSDANAPNVAGWGNVDEQSLIITDVLQEAFIAIQDEATCAGVAADFDAETQTCAGTYAVAGVCHGDSGGPLTVLDAGGAPHLWGLTSYGPQGIGMPPCDLRVPAIFSLVPAFAGWVDAETAEGQTPPGPAGPLAQPPRPVPMAPAVDRTRPVLSGVRLSRSRFAAAGKGAAIVRRRGARLSFTLSEPAGVRITVLRGSKALSSTAPIAMPAGPTTKRFSGRVRGRALRPGRYRLRIGAVDVAGNAARRATVGFRIVR